MASDPQAEANRRLWESAKWVREYANRTLRPVEVVILARHREALSGRVLELGPGAGRLTGYLLEFAQQLSAIDISEAMVAYCAKTYPEGDFQVGDLRDLSRFDTGASDAVVAAYNVLDVLSDEERARTLDDIARVLSSGGMLILSSHNLASAPQREKPTHVRWGEHPIRIAADLARVPRRVRNHRRVRSFERTEDRYAILNDISQDYGALHYYLTRDEQERQLREHGFELLECLDLDGHTVAPGEQAAHSAELHYVARLTP